MEINFKIIVLLLGVILTGLTAGLCFTWFNAITPGMDDLGFLKSFQAMNRQIINPAFLITFFGPVILLFLNVYMHRQANLTIFWLYLTAAVLFFVGIGLITVFKNVPLNELLDKTILENLSAHELKALRTKFEQPWNHRHVQRTIASFMAFALLVIGLMYSKM